ncbi:TPA: type IV toxin-antitoxin system YeeU family antitoxin [Escherichia coli]|nr:type IV toxin-antitoxin system YeeU family antitoxin [Escherichia coli]
MSFCAASPSVNSYSRSTTLLNTTLPANHHISEPWWGLKRNITPCFGARLVQEGNRLHYLADRASITGTFTDADLRHLDQAFPVLLKQMELMLVSGELSPRHQHCVTLYAKGLTCEADSLGSHGYIYIAIYPTPSVTS